MSSLLLKLKLRDTVMFPSSDKRVKLSHLRNKSTKAMGGIPLLFLKVDTKRNTLSYLLIVRQSMQFQLSFYSVERERKDKSSF